MRIGVLPVTQPWKKVVEKISGGADVATVAGETIAAARRAFLAVGEDRGFRECAVFLTQLAVAGGKKDASFRLCEMGVSLPETTSLAEVSVEFSQQLDSRIDSTRKRTDFGEMAQQALVSSLTEHVQKHFLPLIPPSRHELLAAFKDLSKPEGFGAVVRDFTAKLTNATLSYFLSKTLGTQVGESQQFATTNQVSQFEGAMKLHCEESSAIVERFAGEWLSKRRFVEKGNISRESIERFSWYSMQKMRLELEVRANGS